MIFKKNLYQKYQIFNTSQPMKEEDKKGDFSIKQTFRQWLQISDMNEAVFIVGNIAVGKTTICHLIKKILDNVNDPNLKLVQKKKDFEYQYEGEINPKSTKPLTIYPKVFYIEKLQTNIVQVPARIYQLDKKRPYLDKILNIIGLVHAAKKYSFLFCVEAKNTSGKCEPWKKAFQNIFDNFKLEFLNEKVFQSSGFIITKGSNQHRSEIYKNRMQDFFKLFNEEKRKNEYLAFLNIIQNQQKLGVFTKTVSQNQSKADIQQISNIIKNLTKRVEKQQERLVKNQNSNDSSITQQIVDMQSVQLIKDEIQFLSKFNENLIQILKFIKQMFFEMFDSNKVNKQFTLQKFLQQKKEVIALIQKKIHQDNQKMQNFWSQAVETRYNELLIIQQKSKKNIESILGRACLFEAFKQKIQNSETSNNNLSILLEILAEYGLIGQIQSKQLSNQTKQIFKQLIQYSLFQSWFGPYIKNINYKNLLQQTQINHQFRELNFENLKHSFIQTSFSLDQTPENAKLILTFLEKWFPDDKLNQSQKQKKDLIVSMFQLSSFDETKPQRDLPEICKLLDDIINAKKIPQQLKQTKDVKKIGFLNKLALIAAGMLKNYQRPDLCAEIYQDLGKFYSAKQCYEEMLQKNKFTAQQVEPILKGYLGILISMRLIEKAIETCFEYLERFKELRSFLLKSIDEIDKKRSMSFSQDLKKKIFNTEPQLASFYTKGDLFDRIRRVAQQIGK